MVFAVFDHDALVAALQTVWKDIAPSAMFTAAANNVLANSEDFTNALDMIKWNSTVSNVATGQKDGIGNTSGDYGITNGDRAGYGYSFGATAGSYTTDAISASSAPGSNNEPELGKDGYVEKWKNNGDKIYVPAGFAPIRGENVIYADTLPPFDITLTFASEYGHTAFQKIYDVDILNESSGASVDTVVMARQVTWIARRLSPLIRGVYTRDEAGKLRGVLPTEASTDANSVSNAVQNIGSAIGKAMNAVNKYQ
jgi:hypothetical protein